MGIEGDGRLCRSTGRYIPEVIHLRQAYLDNSATTAVCRPAAEKALYIMTQEYGNPSSLHTLGFAAEKEMTAARQAVE